MSRAVTDGEIHFARAEVHQFHIRRQPHVDLWMSFLEPPEPGHQPLGREGRGGRQGQPAPVNGCRQHRCRLGQSVESFAQCRERGLRGVGQQKSARRALEQRRPHIVLEILDLLRNRAGGHRQLVGRAAEIQMTRGGFEGPQRVQRRKPPTCLHSFPYTSGRRPSLRNGTFLTI